MYKNTPAWYVDFMLQGKNTSFESQQPNATNL